ncbi:scaffold attachment factor B2-like isoform X2 [Aphidius gifuensis]|uniref:scaffold attachment factor B2-like isoform X2 n=1 Tax=Aphidius gifuensis TaxID=684658 RepID=UPI001CDCCC77|nr:scaffold attachment factor B2-like isoform X2 [Aphidius gifuensis]
MADIEGKKLAELRVIDLKTELERRGLDKTGNKAALLERLSKAIAEDGEDPEEYLIIPCGGSNKINPRKNSVTGSVTHDESHDSQELNNHNKDKDDVKDNQQNSNVVIKLKKDTLTSSKNTTQEDVKEVKKDVDEEAVTKKEEKKVETVDEPMETNKNNDKIDDKINPEPEESDKMEKIDAKNKNGIDDLIIPPPAPVIAAPAPPAPIVAPSVPKPIPTSIIAEANGIDNEDSINLTIGEDEENLLAEETETHFKQRDGGVRKRIEDNNNKKGEPIKGNCRSEATSSSSSSSIIKDGTSSSLNSGNKIKLDTSDGGKSSDLTGIKGPKRDEKDKKTLPINASSRNLWVSGLSSTTRATDLKQIFSRYGKVIGAKVVTNAKTPGARCYGYVTMSTNDDAGKCIQHLHKTELHGRVISVEKAKGDNQQSHTKKRDAANGKQDKKDEKAKDINLISLEKKEPDQKENEEKSIDAIKKLDDKGGFIDDKKIDDKDADARSTKSTSKKPDSERGRRGGMRQENHRSGSRSRSRERRRRDDVLTFAKIREERERQRLRDRERMLREEERRRREDMERQREIERRQREEAARLEREREKLRRERERIEQEKAELLRLERERQKLEREKLERERIELKRQQMRLEESRRVPPPTTMKRTSSDRRDLRELYVEPDRKRMATEHRRGHSPSDRVTDRRTDILDRVSERRMDTPPSSGRYDSTRSSQEIGLKKDGFKRSSEFSSRSSRPDTFTDVSRGREVIVRRDTLPIASSASDPRQVKERYERPSTTSYGRSDREVRRTDTDNHRSSRDSHTGRYSDSTKPPGSSAPGRDSRYGDSSRNTSSWHSVPPSKSSFNSVTTSGSGGGSGSVAGGGGSGSGGGGNSSVSGQRSGGGGGGDLRNEATSWSSRSSDNPNRWNSSSSIGNTLRHPGPPMGYQGSSGSGGAGAGGGPMQSIGLTAPGTTPSYERFDPYKSSMPNMRKY